MPARVSSTRFVGRAAELAELTDALAAAADGRPSVVLVGGDSGVGKSRLASELIASTEEVRVLCGDCVELGEGELPYAPLIAALRPLAREADPALAALPDAVRSELARLLPTLGPTTGDAPTPDDGLAQARLFEALLALLHALGRTTPVLFFLEDIHWADRSTRSFLAFLARSLLDERVLVLATYRLDELHRRHPLRPLLAELGSDIRSVRRVTVSPFSPEELACALEDILGAAPDPGLVQRLFARSEGNPLYTEELVAAQRDGRGGPPRSLRDALMLRIERMDEAAQELLRVLAVGRRLDHGLLADASGLPDAALRDALREVVAAQVVMTDAEGGHAFRHALLREVAYDDLLPGERYALHRTLAGAIERRAETRGMDAQLAAAIAHHRLAAGDEAAALAASVRAAEEADGVGAHGEAAAQLERALELWERVPEPETHAGVDHIELLLRTSHQYQVGSESNRPDALLRQALTEIDPEGDPRRAAAILEQVSRAQWFANRSEEALASLERGLALVPPGDPTAERGSLLAWLARGRMLQGRYAETIRAAREAREIAEAVGDSGIRGRALNPLGVAQMATGETEEGAAVLREAIAVARERRALLEIGSAGVNLGDRLHLSGRSREGLAVARETEGDFAAPGVSKGWIVLLIAEISFDIGEWDETRRILGSLRSTSVWSPTGRLNLGLRRAELALLEGEHGTVTTIVDDLREIVEESTEPQFLAPFGVLRAQLRRRTGDLDGALAAVEETLDRLEFCTEDAARLARISVSGVAVEADRAERARDLGDADAEALAVLGAEVMLARAEAAGEGGGPVERAWALAARADLERARARGGDPALYRAAAEAWDALERAPQAALNRWREAEAHAARGETEPAREAACAALAFARRVGATWLVREIESLGARARLALDAEEGEAAAPGSAAEPEDPFGLTPRERQVLSLVAAGATNREVGERLFMAEKTASVHVSRILRKLGVSSRTQAAAVAHRLGLEDAPD